MDTKLSRTEDKQIIITSGFADTQRIEVITLGETYIIRPLNARRPKFTGSTCTVMRFLDNHPHEQPYNAIVFLHQEQRHVQVELVDLASPNADIRRRRLVDMEG